MKGGGVWGMRFFILYGYTSVVLYSLELGEFLERASLSVSVAGGLQRPVRGIGGRWGARATKIKILYIHTAV